MNQISSQNRWMKNKTQNIHNMKWSHEYDAWLLFTWTTQHKSVENGFISTNRNRKSGIVVVVADDGWCFFCFIAIITSLKSYEVKRCRSPKKLTIFVILDSMKSIGVFDARLFFHNLITTNFFSVFQNFFSLILFANCNVLIFTVCVVIYAFNNIICF